MALENKSYIIKMMEEGKIPVNEVFRQLNRRDTSIYPKQDQAKSGKLVDVMEELAQLIGLNEVKKLIKEIGAYVEIRKRRELEGLASDHLVLHMIFSGNPGTGKTTVARIIGKLFKDLEVLQSGHLIEVERADLVGEYIGHTAQKTREQLKKAMGGILFIDEAYSLARGGEKDFGKEAIDTIVKVMEDHKENIIVILAGYKREMQKFIQTNPGLKSRFPIQIDFPDYSLEELVQIAEQMLHKRQYNLNETAKVKLKGILNTKEICSLEKGNARFVRNLIETAIRKQACRLVKQQKITRDDLMVIKGADFSEVIDI
jgi:stage V sporulation protein K